MWHPSISMNVYCQSTVQFGQSSSGRTVRSYCRCADWVGVDVPIDANWI